MYCEVVRGRIRSGHAERDESIPLQHYYYVLLRPDNLMIYHAAIQKNLLFLFNEGHLRYSAKNALRMYREKECQKILHAATTVFLVSPGGN